MEKDSLKPCLVQTSQGFSVKYKERLLYSKYNPAKNILTLVQKSTILPGTVILCISPALNYGIREMSEKLPEDCLLLGIELEEELFELSKSDPCKQLPDSINFLRIPKDKILLLPSKLEEMNHGEYKRCIRIDFSNGSTFHSDFYNQLYTACQNSIGQFWKNRITLVKFGRRYAGNILKNLPLIEKSRPFFKVSKPIIVVGAGESAVKTLNSIKNQREQFFILSVDAVLSTLNAMNIISDAVICEEAQDIIAGAFTGNKNQAKYFFVSASTNQNVTKLYPSKNIFYATEYAKTGFFKKLEESGIFENVIPPLGSVGLSAVEIALKLRKDESIPIYVTGLDFSFSKGCTHAKDSFHDKKRRNLSNRLNGIENFGAAFSADSKAFSGKDGSVFYTNSTLFNYAELFSYRFTKIKNLFDAGKTGLSLGLEQKTISSTAKSTDFPEDKNNAREIELQHQKIKTFIESEINALHELKNIFTGKIKLEQQEREKRILNLLSDREYLFIHFPDGYKLNLSQDFLNRIRIELDYFLKILKKSRL